MTDPASLFRNSGGDDDAITIQATNANSHLGTLLLESDWDECASYLRTPDGRRDVIDGMYPLGILHRRRGVAASNSKDGCTGEGTVLFAALYVRAPYDIVRMIHDIQTQTTQPASDHLHISNYLVYVLYVVPSEEASQLHSPPATTALRHPYYQQTRAWSMDEYEKIIHLLLRSISSSSSSSSSTLLTCYQRTTRCGGVGNNIQRVKRTCSLLTPLAIACYNYNVPPSIVSALCTLQPCAMDVECTFFTRNTDDNEGFFVKTLPLFLAAASPLPTNKLSSPEYEEMHERRWNKVKLLTSGMEWYNSNKQSSIDDETSLYTTAVPEPTSDQVKRACLNAIQYEEWELVREYTNRYPAVSTEMVVPLLDDDNNNVSTTTTIANALAQHDNHHTEALQHHKRKKEKRRKRREWLHRNMGPVMYEIDAIMDVVRAVIIPIGKKNKRRGGNTGRGIVLHMGI